MIGTGDEAPARSAVAIEVESFTSEAAAALTAAQYVELRSRYGPFGAPHPLASDFEEPHGVFLVARRDAQPVACGGVRFLEQGVAEIRRMYTLPAARRMGIGARLLVELERHARRLGYRAIRLETGWLQPEALGLYERAGYLVIPCYGEFNDRESVCMEKGLAGPGRGTIAPMGAEAIRVMLVEDHGVMAAALEALFGAATGVSVVAAAYDVASVGALAAEHRPDVALIDYQLPDGSGADAARAIRLAAPDVALVILSAESSDASVLAAVEAGACGYLLKTEAAHEVIEAVRRAARGEMLIQPAELGELLGRQRARARSRAEADRVVAQVTPREREVLRLMAQGRDNQDIAGQLGVEYTTVRSHVRSVIGKLSCHSKLEAVARAAELGMLEALA